MKQINSEIFRTISKIIFYLNVRDESDSPTCSYLANKVTLQLANGNSRKLANDNIRHLANGIIRHLANDNARY